MQTRRVVITGTGVVTPFGQGTGKLVAALESEASGISRLPEPAYAGNPGPQIAGIIKDIDISSIPRKNRRSMSPMSAYTYLAAREALDQAGISEETVTGGRLGMSVGSTLGSVTELEGVFAEYIPDRNLDNVKAMMFFKIMGHSVAANVSQALGVSGQVVGASAACSSGAQSIGLGYEAVAHGLQDYMLCGGADEYHPLFSATFDMMAAASTAYNDCPDRAPRPFDRDRDGVVCAEGTGVVLLETLESATARGAKILAEIAGFSCSSDAASIATPNPRPVKACMEKALAAAGVTTADIGYINAHATGTVQGDIAESEAIAGVFGDTVPVSSLKGHLGHTMAASGAIEIATCVAMMQSGTLFPTRNLDHPAEECGGVMHLQKPMMRKVSHVLKNSFAFGGINCSLILREVQ